MNGTPVSTAGHDEPGFTEIRVKGHLDKRWINWFDGLTITLEDNGHTRLTGHGVDQTALCCLASLHSELASCRAGPAACLRWVSYCPSFYLRWSITHSIGYLQHRWG